MISRILLCIQNKKYITSEYRIGPVMSSQSWEKIGDKMIILPPSLTCQKQSQFQLTQNKLRCFGHITIFYVPLQKISLIWVIFTEMLRVVVRSKNISYHPMLSHMTPNVKSHDSAMTGTRTWNQFTTMGIAAGNQLQAAVRRKAYRTYISVLYTDLRPVRRSVHLNRPV